MVVRPGGDAANRADTEAALATTNGLSMLNGLSMTNGLSMVNGLSGNGLSGNGLLMTALKTGIVTSGSMMNSTSGRNTMSYIVRCALPSGHSISAKDSGGTSYSFSGAIGVAPEWETGTCNTTCQERMTGCLLAHVNTSGVHIPIWLDSEGAIGWGQNSSYPFQEGSFFGNIFVSPPKGYFCNGKDFSAGTVPGRLGVGQTNAPYFDPFGTPGPCASSCTASSAKTNGVADGYSTCYGYTHVVTVWRNFDVNTQYSICDRENTKCIEVAGSSTSNGAAIQMRTLQRVEQPALDDHPDVDRQVQGRQRRDRQGAGSQRRRDRRQHRAGAEQLLGLVVAALGSAVAGQPGRRRHLPGQPVGEDHLEHLAVRWQLQRRHAGRRPRPMARADIQKWRITPL